MGSYASFARVVIHTMNSSHPSVSPGGFLQSRKLVLLAPERTGLPVSLTSVRPDSQAYYDLLARMQHFRGDADTKADLKSWHVLLSDDAGEIAGCCRYTVYRPEIDFSHLLMGRLAVAHSKKLGATLRSAVEKERSRASLQHMSFVELGGWAISDDIRHSPDAVRLALATYALARHLQGGIGVTHVMPGHSNASIFRKINGPPLLRYFDPGCGCEMEFGRFDSELTNSPFVRWITQLSTALSAADVITVPRHRRDTISQQ